MDIFVTIIELLRFLNKRKDFLLRTDGLTLIILKLRFVNCKVNVCDRIVEDILEKTTVKVYHSCRTNLHS